MSGVIDGNWGSLTTTPEGPTPHSSDIEDEIPTNITKVKSKLEK